MSPKKFHILKKYDTLMRVQAKSRRSRLPASEDLLRQLKKTPGRRSLCVWPQAKEEAGFEDEALPANRIGPGVSLSAPPYPSPSSAPPTPASVLRFAADLSLLLNEIALTSTRHVDDDLDSRAEVNEELARLKSRIEEFARLIGTMLRRSRVSEMKLVTLNADPLRCKSMRPMPLRLVVFSNFWFKGLR